MTGSPKLMASNPITEASQSTLPLDPFDTPQFNRLLDLMEKQNVVMEEQKKTLVKHGQKFDILIKDAVKDDQPYDQKPLNDEPTWSALYEIATGKMKEEAEEWKGFMDVSLVFIAIFLAVLTAFLVPAVQNLSPSVNGASIPVNSTSQLPPLPPRQEQNPSRQMFNAVLCVLGRQWVGKLLSRPTGNTHLERTIRHEERKRLAYVWIKPLVTVLYWSLLSSIALFMSGLFYQLQNLATSFDGRSLTLETTFGVGLVLAAGIGSTITATAIHAVRFENSPFEGSLSHAMVRLLRRMGDKWKWIRKYTANTDWQWTLDDRKQICTYMRLVTEASDPKLLERAVPSLSLQMWLQHGEESLHLL
ncbi:hypothetical protein SISSUDRAFT_1064043 [Sistotremastrum suecicum HHB10207 ss-3]|uniref:DUF6535 domain-containing protein n=1 Tax=Sistotremastrum suecicum HHB10207 ss-3 TaxID=1314776 RepID=A0A166B408_9AGAM|nr:hypothetical protein SISSUDRAFT_1064043 [Sistotremastrum suecicum HHB10207 ss-3]